MRSNDGSRVTATMDFKLFFQSGILVSRSKELLCKIGQSDPNRQKNRALKNAKL